MAKRATKKRKTSTSSTIPDWTKLPEELLRYITEKMNCFDVVHARSVCTLWRSTFPFPSSLVRSSYSLPTYPIEKDGLCSLEKIPFVLFRVPTPTDDAPSASDFLMGLVGRDESADYRELPSTLQCSLRMKIPESYPALNMLDCQILSLGHQYRLICWDTKGVRTTSRNAAILPLDKDGEGGEFIVLRSYCKTLLLLTSAERKWERVLGAPSFSCTGLVTFRGKFYATFSNRKIYVIDPHLRIVICIMPPKHVNGSNHLIPCGNDALFLVRKTTPHTGPLVCSVSRLDEDGFRWTEVTDLGDRVLFVGQDANVCCFANQLPDGCGVSGNSILFVKILFPNGLGKDITYFYKYGPPNVANENVVSEWRTSREDPVRFLKSHPYAFRVEC